MRPTALLQIQAKDTRLPLRQMAIEFSALAQEALLELISILVTLVIQDALPAETL